MRASSLIAIAGAATLAAGAAFAQTDSAPAGGDTAVNPPAAAPDATAPAGGYASSDTLGDPSKLKAGDPNVISNGPVPDTRENRAKYGRPMSHAGRLTRPTGD